MPRTYIPPVVEGEQGRWVGDEPQAAPRPEITAGNFYQQSLDSEGRWASTANADYNRLQSLDARGLPTLRGPAPAQVALRWQDMHDQAVWDYRQRLMTGANDYLKGALGNLQRFRPGGAAAMESGVYGQIANQQMQQAAMTEPLNLMRDYERDAAHHARKEAKKAALMQAGVTLGAAGLSALGGGIGGGALGALAMGAGNAANGYFIGKGLAQGAQVQQPGQPTQTMMGPGLGNTGQVDPNSIGQQQGYGGPMAYQNPYGGGGYGDQGPPMSGAGNPPFDPQNFGVGPAFSGYQGGGTGQATLQGGGGGAAGPSMGGGGQAGGGPQMQQSNAGPGGKGAGAQGGGGGGMAMASPVQQAQQTAMLQHLVQTIEDDKVFTMLNSMLETEAMLRTYGGAA